MKILILEDDDFMARMYEKAFVMKKHKVVVAPNGQAAIDIGKKDDKFDLLIVDLMMPIMNGFDFMAEIKKIKMFDGVPIMILSNLTSKRDAEEAERLGAAQFIIKSDHGPYYVIEQAEALLKNKDKKK